MGKKVININSNIAKVLHRPATNTGYVLYPKVEGYNNLEELTTQAEKDPEYIAKSKLHFNSPSNIRKIWVTGSDVSVQYYSGYINGVENNGKLKKSANFATRTQYDNLFYTAKDIINYSQDSYMTNMYATVDKSIKKLDETVVKGNFFGVLVLPYTCNNIEEIYFDWTSLLSIEFLPYWINQLGFNSPVQVASSFLNKSVNSTISNNLCLQIMFDILGLNIKTFRNRFPRLKTVALISELKEILKYSKINNITFTNLDEASLTWFQKNMNIIKRAGGLNIISTFDDVTFPNESFSIKDNQYKFDREILKDLVKAYETKIKSYKLKMTYGDTQKVEQIEHITNEVERFLVDIEKNHENGESLVKNILIIASKGCSKNELITTFSEFTKPNRDKFAHIIGLKI